MLNPEVVVHDAPQALFEGAARRFLALAQGCLERQGRFRVALAGGSTPMGLYVRLAEAEFPWERIDWFWGDERRVPPEHPDSNYGMAWKTLLSKVAVAPDRVHRVETEFPDAAERYEITLRAVFGEACPRFDLILLGMGADGHTASLFPGNAALEECQRLVVATQVAGLGERITLTLPVLNHAAAVMFLVSGREKREALRAVLNPEPRVPPRPAGLVQAPRVWMVDEAAV
ncbi:6-phosphogluconolactonase [Holophaga foetida]|uniref:6-phosphogluconolactonase n=1 Tax=Holophaga foetida TaxID=35839 RepID=UPI0002474D69|nr:6-phosphogluconolactonase [Holophaga foetida]